MRTGRQPRAVIRPSVTGADLPAGLNKDVDAKDHSKPGEVLIVWRRAKGGHINHFPGYFKRSELHKDDLQRRSPACWRIFLMRFYAPRFCCSLADLWYDVTHLSFKLNNDRSSSFWLHPYCSWPQVISAIFCFQTPRVDKMGGSTLSSLVDLQADDRVNNPSTHILPLRTVERNACLPFLMSALALLHWLRVETRCSVSFYELFYCFHRCSLSVSHVFSSVITASSGKFLVCCCCKEIMFLLHHLGFCTAKI